jgi:hypothetical protein
MNQYVGDVGTQRKKGPASPLGTGQAESGRYKKTGNGFTYAK